MNMQVIVPVADFDRLFEALAKRNYRIIGPTMRDGAIVYDEIAGVADLPAGWTDEQNGGSYRLKPRADRALFGYNVGPHSWKKYLHPPVIRLWKSTRNSDGIEVHSEPQEPSRFAFLGIRSCELKAIAIQDQVFLNGPFVDPIYKTRREDAFLIAVNCTQAGGTCFCVSMQAGPKATSGYDLALTEVCGENEHYFIMEAATEIGETILKEIPHVAAEDSQTRKADELIEQTAASMGRHMETEGIKDLLYRNYDNKRWDDVANRCLTCSNCTMVCPTCFCTTVEDVTDLTGNEAERWRKWDSCFTMDFSFIHGGSVRASAKSRYRQWMTHKLATWIDQFGTSGCVGCGRCITWCPVGIDITEEVRAIRQSESASGKTEENDHHDEP